VSTSGEFGLYHYAMNALPSGPDPHFHRTISESFYLLSGTVRPLYDGIRWIDATMGDYLYVPPGGIHAFRNDSGQPAAMLLLFAPGAPRERYFEELAERARQAGRGPTTSWPTCSTDTTSTPPRTLIRPTIPDDRPTRDARKSSLPQAWPYPSGHEPLPRCGNEDDHRPRVWSWPSPRDDRACEAGAVRR
jgi:mannose-6-phosphate isomerase-like protein (cupin superfamily)